MNELTPIPAEQRRVYYDALRAGRAEAERLGYGPMDDRVFAAFHRALYRPMLDAARADERAKAAEEIAKAIETKRGDRCPECGGKPYSSKALRSIPARIRMKCGGGHTWDVPGGLAAHPNQWCATDAAGIARTYAVRMPGAPQEATEPPAAYPSEGAINPEAQKPAQPDDTGSTP